MNSVFKWLFPIPKSNLEYVQSIIFKRGAINVLDTNPAKDQSFNVGKYLLEFGDKDIKCQLRLPHDNMPLFIFQGDDVMSLRQTVIEVNTVAVS